MRRMRALGFEAHAEDLARYQAEAPFDVISLADVLEHDLVAVSRPTSLTRQLATDAERLTYWTARMGWCGYAAGPKHVRSAEERLAAFLVNWSERLSSRGYSARRFILPMQRTDIANYLSLAPETVSRVIRRMTDDGLIAIDRREVELLKPEALETLAASLLRRS